MRAVLCVAGLLIGLTSINAGAAPGSVSGEGEDVRILNAFTDNPVIAESQLRYTVMVFVNGAGPVTDLTITLPMPAGTGSVTLASTVLAAADQHVSVPTLGHGGLILLSLGIGLLGMMMVASRRQAWIYDRNKK